MFCPSCRAEYRAGYRVCATCEVELVAELPVETREQDLWTAPSVVVWQGAEEARAKELATQLDMAGIPAMTKAETGGDVFRVLVFPATEQVARDVLLLPASEFALPEDLRELENRVAVCPICAADLYYKSRVCGRCLAEGLPPEQEEEVESVQAVSVHHPGDARLIHNKLRMAGIPFHMSGLGPGDVVLPRAPLQAGRYVCWVLPKDLEAAQAVIRSVPLQVVPFDTAPSRADDEPSHRDDFETLGYVDVWHGSDRETAEALRFAFRETEIESVVEGSPTGALRVQVPPDDAARAKVIVTQIVEGVSMDEFAALDEGEQPPDESAS